MRALLILLLPAVLGACAALTPVERPPVSAAGTPWHTERPGDIVLLSQPSWVETYQVCVSPESAAAVSVFVRDRPSRRTIREMAPRLRAGKCMMVSVGREQELAVRQLDDGPVGSGKSIQVHGVGYRPPPPVFPLSLRIARFPHRPLGVNARH